MDAIHFHVIVKKPSFPLINYLFTRSKGKCRVANIKKNSLSHDIRKNISEDAKKSIMSDDFIALIEKIKSIIDTQGFSVEALVNKDDPFRRLTTKLSSATLVDDSFFKEKVYVSLYEALFILDKKDQKGLIKNLSEKKIILSNGIIKLVHLGDPRIYDEGLTKLDPQHLNQLKENLFKVLNELQDLIQSHPSYRPVESQTSVTLHAPDQWAQPQDDSQSISGIDPSKKQNRIATPKIGLAFFNQLYDQDAGNEPGEARSLSSCITQKAC